VTACGLYFFAFIGLDDVSLFPVSVENVPESSNNFYEHNINPTGMHVEGTVTLEWFCYYNCSQSCSSV